MVAMSCTAWPSSQSWVCLSRALVASGLSSRNANGMMISAKSMMTKMTTAMFTFPGQARPWLLPARSWHADYGWDFYPDPLFGVKVFAFVAEVRPRGGGTLVITGSHRVTARFAAALPPGQPFAGHLLHRYLRGDEWFRALTRPGDDDPGRAARFMDADHDADGIPVRVAELTGQPGDVVLAHRGC